ncbi:MAG: hypothetical protein ACW99J_15900 [Candidatus Thorarchaeota archaeon]|jgi:hypothetical protein
MLVEVEGLDYDIEVPDDTPDDVIDKIVLRELDSLEKPAEPDAEPTKEGSYAGTLLSDIGKSALQGVVGDNLRFLVGAQERRNIEQEIDAPTPGQRGLMSMDAKNHMTEWSKAQMKYGRPITSEEWKSELKNFSYKEREESLGKLKGAIKALPEPSDREDLFGKAMVGASRFLGSMGVSFASPMAGTAMVFTQITGLSYDEYRKAGVDPKRAWEAAAINALLQTPIEQAGNLFQLGFLKHLGRTFIKGGAETRRIVDFVEALTKAALAEGLEEGAQVFPEEIAHTYAANPNKPTKEIVGDIIADWKHIIATKGKDAFILGAIGGMGLMGAAGTIQAPFTLGAYVDEKQFEKQVKHFTDPENQKEFVEGVKNAVDIGILAPEDVEQIKKNAENVLPEEVAEEIKGKLTEAVPPPVEPVEPLEEGEELAVPEEQVTEEEISEVEVPTEKVAPEKVIEKILAPEEEEVAPPAEVTPKEPVSPEAEIPSPTEKPPVAPRIFGKEYDYEREDVIIPHREHTQTIGGAPVIDEEYRLTPEYALSVVIEDMMDEGQDAHYETFDEFFEAAKRKAYGWSKAVLDYDEKTAGRIMALPKRSFLKTKKVVEKPAEVTEKAHEVEKFFEEPGGTHTVDIKGSVLQGWIEEDQTALEAVGGVYAGRDIGKILGRFKRKLQVTPGEAAELAENARYHADEAKDKGAFGFAKTLEDIAKQLEDIAKLEEIPTVKKITPPDKKIPKKKQKAARYEHFDEMRASVTAEPFANIADEEIALIDAIEDGDAFGIDIPKVKHERLMSFIETGQTGLAIEIIKPESGELGQNIYKFERPYGTAFYDEFKRRLYIEPVGTEPMAKKTDEGEILKIHLEDRAIEIISRDTIGSNPTQTIVNELFQNSTDAFLAKQKDRVMFVTVGGEGLNWTYEVKDNARGMTLKQVKEKYLGVGAKGKSGTDTSGGLGFAKTAFLIWPKRIVFETRKRTPNGSLEVTNFDATPDDIKKGLRKGEGKGFYQHKILSPAESMGMSSGTDTYLVLPDEASKRTLQKRTEFYIERLRKSPPVKIMYDSGDGYGHTENTTKTFKDDPKKYPKITVTQETPDGPNDCEVYFIKSDRVESAWGKKYRVPTRTYNKGMEVYVDDTAWNAGDLAYPPGCEAFVNFTRTVDPGSMYYPFLNNRTSINYEVVGDVQQAIKDAVKQQDMNLMQNDLEEMRQMIDEAPVVGGIRVLIPYKDRKDVAAATKLFKEHEAVFTDFAKMFKYYNEKAIDVGEPEYELCITCENTVHGMRIRKHVAGYALYAINPFAVDDELLANDRYKAVVEAGEDPIRIRADSITETMVHESAHNREENHSEDFSSEHSRLTFVLGHRFLARLSHENYNIFEKHKDRIEAIHKGLEGLGKGGSRFHQIGKLEVGSRKLRPRRPRVVEEGKEGPEQKLSLRKKRPLSTFEEKFKDDFDFDPETEVLIPLGRAGKVPTAVPRFFYHRPPGGKLGKGGIIQGYKNRGLDGSTEAINQAFGTPEAGKKIVWMSRGVDYGAKETYKIDLSKLDPTRLRHTGQAEGNVWYYGDIGKDAIVGHVMEVEKDVWHGRPQVKKTILGKGVTAGAVGNRWILTRNGTRYESKANMHADMLNELGINPDNIMSTGIIASDSSYQVLNLDALYHISDKQLGEMRALSGKIYQILERKNAHPEVLQRLKVVVTPWVEVDVKASRKSVSDWEKEGYKVDDIENIAVPGAVTFHPLHAVMQISMFHENYQELEKTVLHELYEISRGWLMPAKDIAIMERNFKTPESEAQFFVDIASDERLHPDVPGPVRRIMIRFKRYIQAISDYLRGRKQRGIDRPEDVVGKILAGYYKPHFGLKGLRPGQALQVQALAMPSELAAPAPPGMHVMQDPERETEWKKAEKAPELTFLERAKKAWTTHWHRATREYEHLKKGGEFGELRASLLKLAKQKGIVTPKALKDIIGITDDLNPVEYHNFTRYIVFKDFLEEIKLRKKKGEVAVLPGEMTEEELTTEIAAIEPLLNNNVKAALQRRRRKWNELRTKYIASMKSIGINVEARLKREHYFRHVVLDYIDSAGVYGTGERLKSPTYRSHLKQRSGAKNMIMVNYAKVEHEVMSQMLYDIELANTIKSIDDNYNEIGQFKTQAADLNYQNVMEILNDMAARMGEEGITGEKLYAQLGTKTAIGFDNLGRLAAANELDIGYQGEWTALVEALGLNWAENAAIKADLGKDWTKEDHIPLNDPYASQLLSYANWVLKTKKARGKGAAATIFKGIAEKRQAVADLLGPQFMTWRKLVKDHPDYTEWQPDRGNIFFNVHTIPEQIAEDLISGALETAGIGKSQIKRMLAMGGRKKSLVVKNEIAATLDNLTATQGTNLGPNRWVIKKWKQWQLLMPRRLIKYNFRNLTGDADAMFAGNFRSFKKVPQAFKELMHLYMVHTPVLSKENKAKMERMFGAPEDMTENMQDWMDRGGPQTLLQAQEMDDVSDIIKFGEGFAAFSKGVTWKDAPLKVIKGYWKVVRRATDMREAVLRYANYLDYMESMMAHPEGKPHNFGASIPEEIMGMADIRDRAFFLSNDLLGAYDRVSHYGQSIRRHWIPFWSWKEVNFRRYKQILINAYHDKGIWQGMGKTLTKGVAIRTPFLAVKGASVMLSLFWFQILLGYWNSSFGDDEEENLPEDVRNRPHMLFPSLDALARGEWSAKNDDGKIQYFSRVGAIADLLEWFSLDTSKADLQDIMEGKKTVMDKVNEIWQAPINVVVQGGNPFLKVGTELLSRQAMFPDVFKPRVVRDRVLHLARSMGVENEYIALMDTFVRPMPSKGYLQSMKKVFVYESDEFESAYYDTFSTKRRFMKKIGKYGEGFWLTPKGTALYNARTALRYNDDDAMMYYMQKYFELGGTRKGLLKSLDNLHPLSGIAKKDRAAFLASLKPDEMDKLVRALVYYVQLRTGINAQEVWETLDKDRKQSPKRTRPPGIGKLGEIATIKPLTKREAKGGK